MFKSLIFRIIILKNCMKKNLFFIFLVLCSWMFAQTPCNGSAPTNVTISNITGTSVFVSWTPTTASSYTVEIREQGPNAWSLFSRSDPFYTISGLDTCKTYEVRVSEICNALVGTPS